MESYNLRKQPSLNPKMLRTFLFTLAQTTEFTKKVYQGAGHWSMRRVKHRVTARCTGAICFFFKETFYCVQQAVQVIKTHYLKAHFVL